MMTKDTNADGVPQVSLTEEQKYIFDLKGWLLIPGVLTEDESTRIREHMYAFKERPDDLAPNERYHYGGPGEMLLDHPVIMGAMNEFVAHDPMVTDDCYGFRYDGSFSVFRKKGEGHYSPHGGGGLHAFTGNSHMYQHQRNKIYSGLTRIVWELNPVEHNRGGTLLLSGSHKAAFDRPATLPERDSWLWETYECPAGSLLIFTEALCHSASIWELEHDRAAILTCYNTVGCKWHSGGPPKDVVLSMPPKRQSLFRGVWTGAGEGKSVNHYVDEANLVV
jgi:hypothetical protein